MSRKKRQILQPHCPTCGMKGPETLKIEMVYLDEPMGRPFIGCSNPKCRAKFQIGDFISNLMEFFKPVDIIDPN